MCRFCMLVVKTNNTPEGFYCRFPTESAICGHVLEAGIDWNVGGDDGSFPILDQEWRINGEIGRNAQDFLDVVDTPFSFDALKAVVTAGNKLEGNYADIRLDARQVKEIHMMRIAKLAQNARDFLPDEPVLGEEIARLYELGAPPHCGGTSPGAVRVSGLPYYESKPHSW